MDTLEGGGMLEERAVCIKDLGVSDGVGGVREGVDGRLEDMDDAGGVEGRDVDFIVEGVGRGVLQVLYLVLQVERVHRGEALDGRQEEGPAGGTGRRVR